MSLYKDLLQQKLAMEKDMDAKIAEAKKAESAPALAECIRLIKEFGFTVKQLGLDKNSEIKIAKEPIFMSANNEPYRGHGRKPQWIKDLMAEHGGETEAFYTALEAFRIVAKSE